MLARWYEPLHKHRSQRQKNTAHRFVHECIENSTHMARSEDSGCGTAEGENREEQEEQLHQRVTRRWVRLEKKNATARGLLERHCGERFGRGNMARGIICQKKNTHAEHK